MKAEHAQAEKCRVQLEVVNSSKRATASEPFESGGKPPHSKTLSRF